MESLYRSLLPMADTQAAADFALLADLEVKLSDELTAAGVTPRAQDTRQHAIALVNDLQTRFGPDPRLRTYAYPGLLAALEDLGMADQAGLTGRDLLASNLSDDQLQGQMLGRGAWGLIASPEPRDRDPELAIALAEKAVKIFPYDGTNWYALGVAEYRAGDFAQAVDALSKMRRLQNGESYQYYGFSGTFVYAMAYWQTGQLDAARQWYDTAITEMNKFYPGNPELRRYRAEAEALMWLKSSAGPSVPTTQP
jgi:tetratricopeptide (TPR) repeat protein